MEIWRHQTTKTKHSLQNGDHKITITQAHSNKLHTSCRRIINYGLLTEQLEWCYVDEITQASHVQADYQLLNATSTGAVIAWKRTKFYATSTRWSLFTVSGCRITGGKLYREITSPHIHITYACSTAFSHQATLALKSMMQATENVTKECTPLCRVFFAPAIKNKHICADYSLYRDHH